MLFLPKIIVFRRRRKPFRQKLLVKKGVSLLPNIFTLGNAFFGYLSIIFAVQGDFVGAAYFILLGAMLDFLDGRVARLLKVSSDFGMQLDSFSDLISFCLAPSILMYFWQLHKFGVFGILVTACFLIAGILRLARFNLMSEQQSVFFIGLPTTIAGCFFAIVLLNSNKITPNNYLVFILFLLEILFAFLMVSNIRFPTFKQKNIRLNKNWIKAPLLVVISFIAVMQFHMLLMAFFLVYFAVALLIMLKKSLFTREDE